MVAAAGNMVANISLLHVKEHALQLASHNSLVSLLAILADITLRIVIVLHVIHC